MNKEVPTVLVFAGKIQEYHNYVRRVLMPKDAPPASFIHMSGRTSMYGHKDCFYAIVGTWNGPRNETMEYLEKHNIKPYEN